MYHPYVKRKVLEQALKLSARIQQNLRDHRANYADVMVSAREIMHRFDLGAKPDLRAQLCARYQEAERVVSECDALEARRQIAHAELLMLGRTELFVDVYKRHFAIMNPLIFDKDFLTAEDERNLNQVEDVIDEFRAADSDAVQLSC